MTQTLNNTPNNTSKNSLCDVNNSALVVIDIQTRLGNAMPEKVLNRVIENSTFLIKSANLLDVPVISTAQYPKGLGGLVEGINDNLSDSAHYIEKTCFSCCGSDQFMQTLQNSGRRQIILTGMEAHVCVLQTAIELQENSYDVFTVSDAICSRRSDNYHNAKDRMSLLNIQQTNVESVAFEWLRDAKNQHFKQISSWLR
ncbi:MAG: isochorismatase family protein [Gammaproteobacteria bacterium]